MKKFILGLLSGFLLAGFGCIIVVFALARFGDRKPAVPSGATLMLRLSGAIPEHPPVDIPLPVFQSQAPVTMVEVWDVLRKAEKDDRIKAILLEPAGVSAGWARLQEIRDGIVRFKRSGKPVYAYLRSPSAREYYLATAADKIFIGRADFLDLKGFRAELSYYRGTLDKLGVGFEVFYAGKYKDGADSYVRTSMTPETREVMASILDQLYGHLVDTIAAARKKNADQVKAIIDEGPFLADQAKAKGLVDDLLFEDQFYDQMKDRLKQTELHKLSHRDYAKIPASSLGLEGQTKIALVVGEGTITRGGSESSPFEEDEGIRSGAFQRMLRQVGEDSSVKGVVLRINSPGGDAIASDEILREVQRLSKKKPMVISMSDLAASGGYYMAMSGDPIVAYPNTFTGSIGVFYGKVNLQGLYSKVGLTTDSIARGRNAEIDSATKPLDEAARKKMQEAVDHTYKTFLNCVADGRKRKLGEVEPLAQGRVWMGLQARKNGLVDELGGLDRAIEILRGKLKLADDQKVSVVTYPRRKSIFEQFFGSADEGFGQSTLAQPAIRQAVRAWKASLGLEGLDLELWQRGGIMELPPYLIRIR